MPYVAINPTTEEELARYDELSSAEMRRRIRDAERAFRDWRRVPLAERTKLLSGAGRVLRNRTGKLADLMTREMGKPRGQSEAEIEKCAWVCDYYAEHADHFLHPEPIETDASYSAVVLQPLGIIFAIMPWNFPFWQVFRFAAPTLTAGNAAVLKHAPNVPGCALAIEEVFREAGYPNGLFTSLFLTHKQAGAAIRSPLIKAVTLTGSTRAGKAVARQAGAVIKKTVLELGGSDPYLILDDADLNAAVTACATSRMVNNGQSCIAAKRFIVVESVRAEFEERLVQTMERVVMGDPVAPTTDLGPLARADLRDTLQEQVRESIDAGARLLLGGSPPNRRGWFYPATVLTDVKRGMRAYREELFGPVATIIPVKNEEKALSVANDTSYGLGAAVFTRDTERGLRIATEELEAGSCFVNGFVKSDPRLPFGGIGESGYGRELSRFGMLEFVNVKTIVSS